MKSYAIAFAAVAALFTGTIGTSASANETGVAQMLHQLQKVGGRTCLVDHFHDGNGSGASKAAAMNAAISAWSGFTAWEYGSSWGRYGLARNKTANCSRSSAGWTCDISAIPCRSW